MPVYSGFNLATQGRNGQAPNVTQNYYSGLNRPNPIGNQLGNQSGPAGNTTAVSPRPTLANPNIPGSAPDYSTWDTRYLDRENARIRQANIDGRRSWAGEDASGFMPESEVTADTFKYNGDLDEDDPRVQEFRRLYGQRTFVDENGNPMQNQGSRGGAASGYRILTLPESGQIYHGLDNQEYLQDGSRIMRLPDGRIIVENANYNGGSVAGAQRAQETSSRQFRQRAARTIALMIAGGVAGGYLGGVEGFAGAGAEAGGVYGGMQGTVGGTFANWTPTLAEGAAGTATGAFGAVGAGTGTEVGAGAELLGGTGGVTQYPVSQGLLAGGEGAAATTAGVGTASQVGVPNAAATPTSVIPPNLPAFPTGAADAIPSLAAPPTAQATSALPFGLTGRDLATGASGLFNIWNSRNARNDANAAADRADPFGQYRQQAGADLMKLMEDPSYLYERAGYKFKQQQGEQGIHRGAANKGYFRSPNMLFDLSKFNSGLASQEYEAEYKRLAEMAGVSINPGTAAKIQANGNQTSTNMRSAGVTQLGSSFFDWLSRNV